MTADALQTSSELTERSSCQGGRGATARPAPAEGGKKTAGLTFEIIHYEKGFQIVWLAGGMRTKENILTDLLHNEMQMSTPEHF